MFWFDALARTVLGAITGHDTGLFLSRHLVQKFGQDRTVAGAGVHRKMNFSVLASAVGSRLVGQPRAIVEERDSGTVHQQGQRACCATARYLDGDGFLASAQGESGFVKFSNNAGPR